MKKINILILALAFVGLVSCGDDDAKSIVDCFGENLLVTVDHTKAAGNPKQVNFEVEYFGEKNLDNTLKWNFGDGTAPQNITGTTVTHTYANPGSYETTVTISLNNGGCSFDVKKHITIE